MALTMQQMTAMLEAMQAENAKLKAAAVAAEQPLKWKVSEKGGISVYGLLRFPVTLYLSQWRRLAKVIADIIAFGEANEALLAKDKADSKKRGEEAAMARAAKAVAALPAGINHAFPTAQPTGQPTTLSREDVAALLAQYTIK